MLTSYEAVEDVEVVDDSDATEVTEVFALAPVARTISLPVSDMGQGVLDCDPLPQLGSPSLRLVPLSQLGKQGLIRMDGDTATI